MKHRILSQFAILLLVGVCASFTALQKGSYSTIIVPTFMEEVALASSDASALFEVAPNVPQNAFVGVESEAQLQWEEVDFEEDDAGSSAIQQASGFHSREEERNYTTSAFASIRDGRKLFLLYDRWLI